MKDKLLPHPRKATSFLSHWNKVQEYQSLELLLLMVAWAVGLPSLLFHSPDLRGRNLPHWKNLWSMPLKKKIIRGGKFSYENLIESQLNTMFSS